MADNRMAIVCERCELGIAIAKFYAVEGWGHYPLNEGRVNEFFAKHADCGLFGHQYCLRYEDEDTWEYDRVGLDNHKE